MKNVSMDFVARFEGIVETLMAGTVEKGDGNIAFHTRIVDDAAIGQPVVRIYAFEVRGKNSFFKLLSAQSYRWSTIAENIPDVEGEEQDDFVINVAHEICKHALKMFEAAGVLSNSEED